MEMMDNMMAEKLTKIIKTAKWGKSHQLLYKQFQEILDTPILEFNI